MNETFIQLNLVVPEVRMNAKIWIHRSANSYLERQAEKAELPLEQFLIQQLSKHIEMYDCIGEMYILPKTTEVFLNEGSIQTYKTTQIFDPKYVKRDPARRETVKEVIKRSLIKMV